MIGKIIDNHKIVDRLGEGGMGMVYKAKHLSLSRMVAMKVLPEHMTRDSSFVQRFSNEARAIASLNHPNIVHVYDVGKEGDNCYYYTMELVDGVSLEDIEKKSGPLPIKRAASIVSSVAKALAYTHKRGIVHRDIKPSNIMIDKSGQVKLTDFGLALKKKAERLTVEGGLIGTPEFMSPEQVVGKTATAQSDIYSLGVVFYEMITGRSPFAAATPLAVIEKIRTKQPSPPRSIRPEIPPAIEQIIMKMMARNPNARYKNCRQIITDLKRFIKTSALTSSRATVTVGAPQGRSPAKKAAIFLLVVFAVGAGVFFLWQNKESIKPARKVSAAVSPATYTDAYATKAAAAMEAAKTDAAAELIPMLVESPRFPEIKSVEVQEQSVIVSGAIRNGTRAETLRRLSDVKLNMEQYCGEVKIRKQESVGDLTEFEIELQHMSDLLLFLGSEFMLDRYPLCGRVWQMAEEKKQAGFEYHNRHSPESAERSFRMAAELYAASSQIAELEKEMSLLDHKLAGIQAKVDTADFPDKVVLKNGEEIECEVIEEGAELIRIRIQRGTIPMPRRNIASLNRVTQEKEERISMFQSQIETTVEQKDRLRSRLDALHLSSIRISFADASL